MSSNAQDQELLRLIQGHQSFRKNYYEGKNPVFINLMKAEHQPTYLVITSTDSCLDPSILLNCSPNDILVHRNLANIVPHYDARQSEQSTAATLEYSLTTAKVKHIIILGHRNCKSIESFIREPQQISSPLVNTWLTHLKAAKQHVQKAHHDLSPSDQVDICCKLALMISLKNLYSYPFIKEQVAHKKLHCHAWYFDLTNGTIESFDESNGDFSLLQED